MAPIERPVLPGGAADEPGRPAEPRGFPDPSDERLAEALDLVEIARSRASEAGHRAEDSSLAFLRLEELARHGLDMAFRAVMAATEARDAISTALGAPSPEEAKAKAVESALAAQRVWRLMVEMQAALCAESLAHAHEVATQAAARTEFAARSAASEAKALREDDAPSGDGDR